MKSGIRMLYPLNTLRFFAAVGIYLFHLNIGNNLAGISLPVFFLLSGFVMAYNYKNEFFSLNFRYYLKYFYGRLARLYPLHLLTFIISIPLMQISQTETSIKSTFLILSLLQTYIPLGKLCFGFNGVSWFLADVLFFYAITPILLNFFYRVNMISHAKRLIALQICLYVIAIFFAYLFRNDMTQYSLGWWFISISPYYNLIYYLLGFSAALLFASINGKDKLNFKHRALLFSLIEVIAISLFIISLYCCYTIYVPFAGNLWLFPSLTILIFVLAFQEGIISHVLSFKQLVCLGSISFEIYMLHFLVIRYSINIFNFNYIELSDLTARFVEIMVFIFVILLSWVVNRYFDKPAKDYLINKF